MKFWRVNHPIARIEILESDKFLSDSVAHRIRKQFGAVLGDGVRIVVEGLRVKVVREVA